MEIAINEAHDGMKIGNGGTLGAIIWAKISKVYYGATDSDAVAVGFADEYIYDVIKNGLKDNSRLATEETDAEECRALFVEWVAKDNRKIY
jgi:guanine deaminase